MIKHHLTNRLQSLEKIEIMQIVNNKESLSDKIRGYKSSGNKITLIPTMGNLHLGHQALFSRAPSNTIKVATIYVNPFSLIKVMTIRIIRGAYRQI